MEQTVSKKEIKWHSKWGWSNVTFWRHSFWKYKEEKGSGFFKDQKEEKRKKTADGSGALTITELSLVGKPSILIPFPYAAENHQFYNAKVLEDAGLGIIINESEVSSKNLEASVKKLLKKDSEECMRQATRIFKEDVQDIIYKNILEVIKK